MKTMLKMTNPAVMMKANLRWPKATLSNRKN
jgi:hypothetical protein